MDFIKLTWNCLECLSLVRWHFRWSFLSPNAQTIVRRPIPNRFDYLQTFPPGCSSWGSMQTRKCSIMCDGSHVELLRRHEGTAPGIESIMRNRCHCSFHFVMFYLVVGHGEVVFHVIYSGLEVSVRDSFQSQRFQLVDVTILEMFESCQFTMTNRFAFIEAIASTMRAPFAHTNPTKFMFAISASHVITSAILFDYGFTTWTNFCVFCNPL